MGWARQVVLEHPAVEEVVTAEATCAEVQEYAAGPAQQKRLPVDLALLAVAPLPVTILERASYAPAMKEAARRIARRDPDDVEILAVALQLGTPEPLPTAALLKQLSAAT